MTDAFVTISHVNFERNIHDIWSSIHNTDDNTKFSIIFTDVIDRFLLISWIIFKTTVNIFKIAALILNIDQYYSTIIKTFIEIITSLKYQIITIKLEYILYSNFLYKTSI